MTQSNITFRQFEPADLDELHRIRLSAYAPVFASFRDLMGDEISPFAYDTAEADQGQHLDHICTPDSGNTVLVVWKDQAIIGFCGYRTDCKTKVGEIGLNAIDPDHVAKGIGTAMYKPFWHG